MLARSLLASSVILGRSRAARYIAPLCIKYTFARESTSHGLIRTHSAFSLGARGYASSPPPSSPPPSSPSSNSLFPSLTPFHLAFPVDDLDASRKFYGETLGCPEGRSSPQWIDFDLFGHQIVAHLRPPGSKKDGLHHNHVDGHGMRIFIDGDCVVITLQAFPCLTLASC